MIKRSLFAFLIIIFLSTYKTNNFKNFFSIFDIKEIRVTNNQIVNESEILKDLFFLYERNILFLNSSKIKRTFDKIEIIDSFEISKIYPNIIEIKIFEKKPVAIIQFKKKKFYFTEQSDMINFFKHDQYNNLPIVFGKKENFEIFYNQLKSINFPIHLINKFYLFDSNRWDILIGKNTTVKLPVENFSKSLKNFMEIKDKSNFNKYNIFDYRINDQLILK